MLEAILQNYFYGDEAKKHLCNFQYLQFRDMTATSFRQKSIIPIISLFKKYHGFSLYQIRQPSKDILLTLEPSAIIYMCYPRFSHQKYTL